MRVVNPLSTFGAGLVAVLLTALLVAGCSGGGRQSLPTGESAPVAQAEPLAVEDLSPATLLDLKDLPAEARLDLAVLRAAYPGAVQGLERGKTGHLLLVLTGNRRFVYDDGKMRTARQALDEPDIRTMLAQVYPLGPVTETSSRPVQGFDPGRSRVEPLFGALYGRTEAGLRGTLVRVPFLKRAPMFTTRFGAAEALGRVGKRLATLQHDHPDYRRILWPLGGTFVWREIAGTNRLSMHSFGIAIDLNPSLPYWRTEPHPETMPARRKAFPPEILAAFEAEGFIWGGKWAAFDLMHFEYRPELILKAKALAGQVALP